MTLTENDWINTGTGCLYAAPFVGQYMLFQYFDPDCSLLVYHDSEVDISSGPHEDAATVQATVREPDVVHVHFSNCSSSSRELLLRSPRSTLVLRETGAVDHDFEALHLTIGRECLRVDKMLTIGPKVRSGRVAVGYSGAQINAPARLERVPGFEHFANLSFRCWSVDVSQTSDAPSKRWALKTFDLNNDPFDLEPRSD